MTAKITRKRLNEAGFVNDHDLATAAATLGLVGVFVDYRPPEDGRITIAAAWQVIRPGFQTDPKAHWSDYGRKTFTIPWGQVREQKDSMRSEAIAWASQRYRLDPEDWLPSPFGRGSGWFPGPVLRAVLEAVTAGATRSRADGSLVLPGAGEEK